MVQHNSSDFIDIKGLLRQYISKWYLFVISVIVCAGLAFVYTKIKAPVYAVRANVLISQEKSNPMSSFGALGDLFGSDGYVDDEIFIISSHSLYRDVVRDLNTSITHMVKTGFLTKKFAYPNFPVTVVPAEGILDTLTHTLVVKADVKPDGIADLKLKMMKDTELEFKDIQLPADIETPLGVFTVTQTKYFPADENVKTTIVVNGYDAAAEALDEEVVNEIANKRSNVITMAINTPNPLYGKRVLNEIIKKYNERGIAEKNAQGLQTAEFIDERLDLIAKDLSDEEIKIQQYKESHGIIDVTAEAKYQTEKKGRLDEALLTAETQAEIIKMTRDFIQDPSNAYNLIPMTVDNAGLQKGIESYNELILRRMELLNNAKPDNAVLRQLSEQVDAMRANIGISVAKALETAEITVRDLRNEYKAADSRLGNIPTQEREYLDMKRQQTVKHQLYLFLLQKREETAMLLANAIPKGLIIDEAFTMHEPLGMSRKALMLLAIFFGLCVPPVWLYLRKLMRNRFETRQEVERMTDVPILGEMCIDKSGRRLVVTSDDTSSATELFRLMRSNLLFILNDPRDKVVLLTSTSSGEGKSYISINLAASLALLNKRVLLVGMDIRNPRLAQYLDINPEFGLTQYLSSSSVELDQIIYHLPEVEGLDIISAGPIPPNPAELLASTKVDEMFKKLRPMYDYIIVDTAPIGLVSDTFTLDRLADASIYVCRANYTSLSDLEIINDIYEQHRLKKLSLAINGTAAKKSYGYGQKKK